MRIQILAVSQKAGDACYGWGSLTGRGGAGHTSVLSWDEEKWLLSYIQSARVLLTPEGRNAQTGTPAHKNKQLFYKRNTSGTTQIINKRRKKLVSEHLPLVKKKKKVKSFLSF